MATKFFDDEIIEQHIDEAKASGKAISVEELEIESVYAVSSFLIDGLKNESLYAQDKYNSEVLGKLDGALKNIDNIYSDSSKTVEDKKKEISAELDKLSKAKSADGKYLFAKVDLGLENVGNIAAAARHIDKVGKLDKDFAIAIDLAGVAKEISDLTVKIHTTSIEAEKQELSLRRDALSFMSTVEMVGKLSSEYANKQTKDSLVTNKTIKNIEVIASHKTSYEKAINDKSTGFMVGLHLDAAQDKNWYDSEINLEQDIVNNIINKEGGYDDNYLEGLFGKDEKIVEYHDELSKIRDKQGKYASMSDDELNRLDGEYLSKIVDRKESLKNDLINEHKERINTLETEKKYAQSANEFYRAMLEHFANDYSELTDDPDVLQVRKDICDRIARGTLTSDYILTKLTEHDGKILKDMIAKYGDIELRKISTINPYGTPKTKEELFEIFPIPTTAKNFGYEGEKPDFKSLPAKETKDAILYSKLESKFLSEEYTKFIEMSKLLPEISAEDFEKLQKTITDAFAVFGKDALPKEFVELIKSKDKYVKNIDKCKAIINARRDKDAEILFDIIKSNISNYFKLKLVNIPPRMEILNHDGLKNEITNKILTSMGVKVPPISQSDKSMTAFVETEVLSVVTGSRNPAHHDKSLGELIKAITTDNASNIAMQFAQDKFLRTEIMLTHRERELAEKLKSNPADAKLKIDQLYENAMNCYIMQASTMINGINTIDRGTVWQKVALAKLFVVDDKAPGYKANDPKTWIFKQDIGPDGAKHYLVNKDLPYATDKKDACLVVAGVVMVAEAQGKVSELVEAKQKAKSKAKSKDKKLAKQLVKQLEKELKEEYSAQQAVKEVKHAKEGSDWHSIACWTSPKAKMKFYEKLLKALDNYLASPVKVEDIDIDKTKTIILTERDLAISEDDMAKLPVSAKKLMFAEECEFIDRQIEALRADSKLYDASKGKFFKFTQDELIAISAEPMDKSKLDRLANLGVRTEDPNEVKKYVTSIGRCERLEATQKLMSYLTEPEKRDKSYKEVLGTFIDDELIELGITSPDEKKAIIRELENEKINVDKLSELTGKDSGELDYLITTAERRNILTGKEKAGVEIEKEVFGIYDITKGVYISSDGKVDKSTLTIAFGLAGTTSADYLEIAKDLAAEHIDLGKELDSGKSINEIIASVGNTEVRNRIIEKHERINSVMSINSILVAEDVPGLNRESQIEEKIKPSKDATKLIFKLESEAITEGIDVDKLEKAGLYSKETGEYFKLTPEEEIQLQSETPDLSKLTRLQEKGIKVDDTEALKYFYQEYKEVNRVNHIGQILGSGINEELTNQVFDMYDIQNGKLTESVEANADVKALAKGLQGTTLEEYEEIVKALKDNGVELGKELETDPGKSIDSILDSKVANPELREKLKKKCKELKEKMKANPELSTQVEIKMIDKGIEIGDPSR